MPVLARLYALRRERPVFVGLAALTLGLLLVHPAVDWWLRSIDVASTFSFRDFSVYDRVTNRWLTGQDIYVRNDDGGFHGEYLYPPPAILAFAPFVALFDWPLLHRSWAVATFLFLWVGLQLVAESLGADLAWYERGLLAVAAFGFQPILLGFKMGQTSSFLVGLLCLAFYALQRGERPFADRRWRLASGALTTAVGAVKPSYGAVGAHLLADRDRLVGAVGAGAAILLGSLLLFGVDANLSYLSVIEWGLERGDDPRSPALWLPPYYKPLGWVPASFFLRVALVLAIAAAAVLAGRGADREVFALGVAAFPIVTPLTYTYYLAAVPLAAVVLVAVEFERDGYPALPVLSVLLVHLHAYGLRTLVDAAGGALPGFVDATLVYFLLQPGLWGNALLLGLAARRVAESATVPPDPDEISLVSSER